MAEMTIEASWKGTSVETGIERIKQQAGSLKSGAVGGAFKALASDLAMANGPAEMLAATMNRLATTLKSTTLGAVGIAIGKLLAAPFEQLSMITQSAANSAKTAIGAIQKSAGNMTFDQAISQAQALQSAIDEIGSSIQKINTNPFLRLADVIMGVSKELKLLQDSLRLNIASNLSFGAEVDAQNAEQMVGKTDEEKQRLRIKQEAEAKRRKARDEIPGTGINLETTLDAINREEAAKLKELDIQKQNKAKEDQKKIQQDILKTTEQIAKVEEKIRQGRMKEPELADELVKKYEQLKGMQALYASFGTLEGQKQAAQFGLEAAQIKEQLAGMGRASSPGQILADSLQQVSGGGRSAFIGGQSQIDYLKKLNDTGDRQHKALMEIVANTGSSNGKVGVN
ncbi:MAG: hypothetical protein EBS49_00930 [Verrucomicrobia bacterium]|nr:hypothetical protein [Verrucomicrobiota bacterium]NBU68191.1 hypothetical protein [Verrucomicrobiota bacterium]